MCTPLLSVHVVLPLFIQSTLVVRSKLPIVTGDFTLPYLLKYISETLYSTTVEFDTLLNERLAITFITTKMFLISVKAVQSSVILVETRFRLIEHLDAKWSYSFIL